MPTHLRLLKGNAGKRAINKQEPQPPRGRFDPPEWLVELDLPIAELEAMPLKQLREIANNVGIQGRSRMPRERLLAEIVACSEGDRLRFWRRIQGELVQMGVMTSADRDALGLLCATMATFVECQRFVRDHGRTFDFVTKAGVEMPMQYPEIGIGNAAISNAIRLMDRFGLEPSYRSKLKTEAEQEADGLDALRKRGSNDTGHAG